MKIQYYVIFACIVMLLISGCSRSGGSDVKDDYRRGSQAISLQIDSQALPSLLGPEEQVAVVVEVQNEGAWDIDRGTVRLTTDESVFSYGYRDHEGQNYASFSLEGKSQYNPRGEVRLFEFPLYVKPLPSESQRRTADVVVSSCFDYGTIHLLDVCIDTDPYTRSSINQQVCETKDIAVSNAGAPVNVDKVTVRYNKDGTFIQPIFTFEISQNTNGNTYTLGDEQSFCNARSAEISRPSTLFKATLSDVPLLCQGDDQSSWYVVPFTERKARIVCEADPFETEQNYVAPLSVELQYGFVQTISKQVTISRNPN